MKKRALLLLLFILIVSFTGCKKRVRNTIPEANIRFENFIQEINTLIREKGLVLKEREIFISESEAALVKKYSIAIDENAKIDIALYYYSGRETFNIYYLSSLESEDQKYETIDLELMVDMNNLLAQRQTTMKYCNKFFNAPEEKYHPERIGLRKSSNEIISKVKKYFHTDWTIVYRLYNDLNERFAFAGILKD